MRETVRGVLGALALVAALIAAIWIFRQYQPYRVTSILFLIPVLLAAVRWGTVSALVAAVTGAAASTFFLLPPIYSFGVNDPQQLVNLVSYTLVAIVTSHLATNLKRQLELTRRREGDIRNLYEFSRRLAVARSVPEIHAAIEHHLSSLVQRKVVLFEAGPPGAEGKVVPEAPEPVQRAAVALARREQDAPVSELVEAEGEQWLVRVLSPRARELGVIAVNLGDRFGLAAEAITAQIDAALGDAAATFERLDLGRAITEANIRTETDQLREALLGSVSHELRTPLASIMGAATVLNQAPAVTGDLRLASLANLVGDEAVRLDHDIQNLLDASRINSKGLKIQLEWADPGDIVNAAIGRRRRRLSENEIVLEVDRDLPFVRVDPVLVEQALGQLLDNAAKYSSPGSPIKVTARANNGHIELAVSDRGAGLMADERERVWERFYRGERHQPAVAGSGLGLWIARAFIAANGGRIEAASDGANAGTTVSISFPLPPEPMPKPEEQVDE